ncbi:MAG: MurR/RpiR family transcriptional regulator [Peptostreptococcaceae bacterium]
MNIQNRIKKYEYKFTDLDDSIADFIVNNKEKVLELSIQLLAKEFFTVPNSIMRFCKKIDYTGFSHLKSSLREELYNNKEEETDVIKSSINSSLEIIDIDQIKKAASYIKKSRNFLIYGIGQNSLICENFSKEMSSIHKNVKYYLQPHEIKHEISLLSKKDTILIISVSGESKEIVEVLQKSKEKELTIISLTQIGNSTLQSLANINLYFDTTSENINGYQIHDKIPIMIILRYLFNELLL